jgi:hypothetical protein
VEIHTAEPLSPVSVGDYLYEVSFPDPLAVPRPDFKPLTDFRSRLSEAASPNR